MDYRNFDLRFERQAGGYQALVQASPVGESAAVEFGVPCSEAELSQFAQDLEVATRDEALRLAKDLGTRLFAAAFHSSVEQCLVRSLDQTRREASRLRVRLRLSAVPELAILPWEFLYYSSPDHDEFLALADEISVVRYPDRAESLPALPVQPPLRILVVASNPTDAPRLDTEREWKMVEGAIQPLAERGRVELERCNAGSFQSLVDQLRRGTYHVLHFVGHGMFTAGATGQPAVAQLLFEDEERRAQPVDGQMLAWMLGTNPALRLVVLNACEAARSDGNNALSGVAQRLVQTGTPAVIAMQFSISDGAATAFSSNLYGSIAEGAPLDEALTMARTQMFVVGNQVEWATPVLYMRASDTRLFEIPPTSDEERTRFAVQTLDRRAQSAVLAEDWTTAISALEALVRQAPAYEGATARLQEATRQKQMRDLFEIARGHYDAGRWSEALDYFRQVSNLAGNNYKGVWTFMSTVQSKLRSVPSGGAATLFSDRPTSAEAEGDGRHYDDVMEKVFGGRLVLVLGDDVNLCSRPAGREWKFGQSEYVPSNSDVAAHLAQLVNYPRQPNGDLGAVSQFYAFVEGTGALRERLHAIFAGEYQPTALHQMVASLPRRLRARDSKARLPLIVTTNYDDSLEHAFRGLGEEFDLVSYVAAEDGLPGRFVHQAPGSPLRDIDKPNEDTLVALEQRTVILRVHGFVDRSDSGNDTYVVADDDYIDYASGQDISGLLPVNVLAKLRKSHVLFVGFNPQHWNHRVFFRRIWRDQPFTKYKSWAVAPDPDELDLHFWQRRAVDVINMSLDAYTAALGTRMDRPVAGSTPP